MSFISRFIEFIIDKNGIAAFALGMFKLAVK